MSHQLLNKINITFTTFKPQGYVSAANSQEFLQELTKVVKSSQNSSLLVDMKQVEFMDSAGLMALIEGFRLAKDLNCELAICSVAPPVRILFELTQLDNIFTIFDCQDSFMNRNQTQVVAIAA